MCQKQVLETHFDDGAASFVLEEADAGLDEPHKKSHFGFLLFDADAPDNFTFFAWQEFIFDEGDFPLFRRAWGNRPAVRVAFGGTTGVGVPVDSDPPKPARLGDIFAIGDRRKGVVGGVFIPRCRPVGADRHGAGVFDAHRHRQHIPSFEELWCHIGVGNQRLWLATCFNGDLVTFLDDIAIEILRTDGIGIDAIVQN